MTTMSMNGLNPEEIETLLNDEHTYKTWLIQQIVAINKRLDNIERLNKLYQALLLTVLGVIFGLLSLILSTIIHT